MSFPPEFYAIVCILLGLVGIPAIRIWRNKPPTVKEWSGIKENISEWDINILDSLNLSDTTHSLLEQVLTSKSGTGQHSAIPLATESIAAIFEYRNRSLKSLASLSVLIGLLGTALVLFQAFHGTIRPADIDMRVIGKIYSITSLSICMAVLISFWNFYSRQRGERVVLLASQALHKLRMSSTEGVDPQLVSALELVGNRFREWGELVHNEHSKKIELLMDEVKGLAGAIRDVVNESMKASAEEGTQTMIVLRHLAERTELISLRLDEGFKLLAQPFIQGVPAIERLGMTTKSLEIICEKILDRDIAGTLEGVERSVRSMDSTVKVLPTTVIGSLKGGMESFTDAMVPVVKGGFDLLIKTALEEREMLRNLTKSVEASFAQGLDSIKNEAESGRVIMKGFEQSIDPKLDQIQNLVSGFSDKMKDAMHKISEEIRVVLNAGIEKSDTHSEMSMESLSRHIKELGVDICGSVNNANSQSLRQQRLLVEGLGRLLTQNGKIPAQIQQMETLVGASAQKFVESNNSIYQAVIGGVEELRAALQRDGERKQQEDSLNSSEKREY